MNADAPVALFDAHAHLQAPQFAGDAAAVWARAAAAGVRAVVCASDDLQSSRDAVALAEQYPGIYAVVGVHPHEAASYDSAVEQEIERLCKAPQVVGVGEIGLDYYRDLSPRPLQRAVFAAQLAIAARANLPIVVHSREAAEDTLAILADWPGLAGAAPHQMHCFGYDLACAQRFLELGFMISIPGTVTYPKAGMIKEVAARVPDAMLTVETDCPYLAPQRHRGRRNEPAYLGETVATIAALRGTEPAQVAALATRNALRLFRLPALAAAPAPSVRR